MENPMSAPLNAQDKALVAFAEKLTRRPGDIGEGDLAPLREVGLSDRGIHDTVQVVALFNYYNRLADGLGVALEDDLL
jgi:uncharacterized peroxidase-related enzyme